MIISGRAEVPISGGTSAHVEHHRGLPAQLWGILYILFGTIAVLIALAMSVFCEGSTRWIEAFFAKSSGIGWLVILAGGLILLLESIVSFREMHPTPRPNWSLSSASLAGPTI